MVLAVPAAAEPGQYPIRAQLRVTGDRVPAAWCQTVEDVSIVAVGADQDAELIYLVDGPEEVALRAGQTARMTVTIGSHAAAELSAEAHLISPWGTWEWIGPASVGAVVQARCSVEFGFDVSPPAWLEPGQWWALIWVGCAGRLVYSPAVRVTVT